MKRKKQVITNSKGQMIVLNDREKKVANAVEMYANAFGHEVDITTLTSIFKKISEQKFYEIKPSDFVPILVGDGAWQEDILTWTAFQATGDFEEGVINTADDATRLAKADSGVQSLTVPIAKWAKSISWSLIQLNQSMTAGKWDVIEQREKARKKNWDLGIQRTAFLGTSDERHKGLLTQDTGAGDDLITLNSTLIPTEIHAMTAAQLRTFLLEFIEAYRNNVDRTVYPTHMVIPETVWNGLAAQTSPDFPIKSTAEVLVDALKEITGNKEFKVQPVAYAMPDHSEGRLSNNRYALYRYDDESLRMFVPVDYTATVANTTDGFMFQNVAYGQFTGVQVIRPKELMYFDGP